MCHWLEKLTFNFADWLKSVSRKIGIKLIAGEEDQKLIIELERNRWFIKYI